MDDDIAAGLPKPPPPAPARRDAAIHAAMRQFDGEADVPAVRQQSGWTWRGSQQAVGWASAAMVALIGVPAAWTYMGQGGPAADRGSAASSNAADSIVAEGPFAASQVAGDQSASPVPASDMADQAPSNVQQGKTEAAPIPPPTAVANAASGRERGAASEPNSPPPMFMAPAAVSAPPPPPAPIVSMPAGRAADTEAVADKSSHAQAPVAEAQRSRATGDDISVTAMRRSEQRPRPESRPESRKATDAIAAFDRAVEQSPRSSDAYLNRGLAYQRAGRPDRAIADLNRAIRFDPTSARAYRSRGALFRQTGNLKRALADEQRAAELDARN